MQKPDQSLPSLPDRIVRAYLAAIIVGPRSISPNEWFFDLFGARGNIGTAEGKMLKAIMENAKRLNAISETLSAASQNYKSIFHRAD